MTVLTEKQHVGAFLLSEDDEGRLSRDNIVLASGSGVCLDGTVLGRRKLGVPTSAAKAGGNTGTGTLVLDATTPLTITQATDAMAGVYAVRFLTATQIQLIDPRGVSLGVYAIGGANGNSVTINDRLKFVVTQAATVFVAGDGFDITVPAGDGKYVPAPATAYDGSDMAEAILFGAQDATSADVAVVGLTRHAEVYSQLLSYHSSVNSSPLKAAKLANLRDRTVVAR